LLLISATFESLVNYQTKPFTLKTKNMRKLLSLSAAALLLLASCSEQNEVKPKADVSLKSTGTDHGYFWSLYREGGSGSISFPQAGTYAGNFQITYSGVNDIVGGKGWSTGSSRTINYNIGYLSGSYDFVGVYGWTTNPLIEYYVAEKGSMTGGTSFGTMSSDGHTYSCYKSQRVNAPSIIGTATFWQYKDTWGGSSTGSNRAVNMGNHINNWRNRGGQGFGSHNYQIFAIEAWGGKSGTINATVW
jgi:endo-1,4-beta-xylanase